MNNNRKQALFLTIRKGYLAASIFLFFTYFLMHLHTDLFSTFITALLLSSFSFAIATLGTALILLPLPKFKTLAGDEWPSHDIKPLDTSNFERKDDYNHDVASPTSPIYQIVIRSPYQNY